jgi:hypothetical protein
VLTVGNDLSGREADSPASAGMWTRDGGQMLADVLIALVIVAIAAVLGLTVHPLLWFIVIVAVLWLFMGSRRHATRV